jgi:hypothetical protein
VNSYCRAETAERCRGNETGKHTSRIDLCVQIITTPPRLFAHSRRKRLRQISHPPQTPKNIFNARTLVWLRRPTLLQHIPQTPYEPGSSSRVFAFEDLDDNGKVRVLVEWGVPADGLVHDHSERITIRRLRSITVFEPEPFRIDKLRAHPSRRATPCVRTRGYKARTV